MATFNDHTNQVADERKYMREFGVTRAQARTGLKTLRDNARDIDAFVVAVAARIAAKPNNFQPKPAAVIEETTQMLGGTGGRMMHGEPDRPLPTIMPQAAGGNANTMVVFANGVLATSEVVSTVPVAI